MKIAYISTYLPRECGIATFNQNVVRAIAGNLARLGQPGWAQGGPAAGLSRAGRQLRRRAQLAQQLQHD